MGDFDITVDASEWLRFADRVDGARPLLGRHMTAAMDSSLDLVIEWMAEETPVNTGALRGSWTKDIFGIPMNLHGIAMTPLAYGLPVETGRKPGTMPPVDAIKLWAKRKLNLSGDELDMAAWAIARHIGAHGTEGAFMVEKAYNRAKGGDEIERIWAAELDEFLKELTR